VGLLNSYNNSFKISATSFPESWPLNFAMMSPMYAPWDNPGFCLMIFCVSSFRLMSDFFDASFRDLPSDSLCIIVLIWFS